MDLIRELGELAFGSRLKRLVKRTDADILMIYEELGVDFRPRWFPLLMVLSSRKRASITDAASAIHYSHTAVNKLAREMTAHGLIISKGDSQDGRKRILHLTRKGRNTVASLESVWKEIRAVTKELVSSGPHNILMAADEIEKQLDENSLYDRLRDRMKDKLASEAKKKR
jgi:DNA-binding MarR family transcriptional regulator